METISKYQDNQKVKEAQWVQLENEATEAIKTLKKKLCTNYD